MLFLVILIGEITYKGVVLHGK